MVSEHYYSRNANESTHEKELGYFIRNSVYDCYSTLIKMGPRRDLNKERAVYAQFVKVFLTLYRRPKRKLVSHFCLPLPLRLPNF